MHRPARTGSQVVCVRAHPRMCKCAWLLAIGVRRAVCCTQVNKWKRLPNGTLVLALLLAWLLAWM